MLSFVSRMVAALPGNQIAAVEEAQTMLSRFPSSPSVGVSERFSRRVSGRIYPLDARRDTDKTTMLPPDDLSCQIEKAVQARWRLKSKVAQYDNYQTLVADYLHDINLLRGAVNEVRTLVIGAWRLNTEFHSQSEINPGARDGFLRRHEERLAVLVDRHLIAPPASLSAKMEAMPLGQAFTRLRGVLDEALGQFGRNVCLLLDAISDQGMVGIVEWATPSACDVSYFKNLIIQQEQETQIVSGEEKVIGIRHLDFGWAEKIRQEVFKVSKGTHLVRRGRYDLYLTEARSTPVQDGHVMIPKDIATYFNSLPPWVKEIAHVVDGKQLRKRLVAMDVDLEHWEDTKVVQVVERERLCGCPVITLGHYVLTGWGDEEDSRELARRSSAGMRSVAILLQLFAVTLFCLGQLLHPGFSIAAAVGSALGLVGFVESRRQAAVARSETASVASLGLMGLLWAVFWIAAMALAGGLVASKVMLLVVGMVGLILGLGILWLVIKAQKGPEESDNRGKS